MNEIITHIAVMDFSKGKIFFYEKYFEHGSLDADIETWLNEIGHSSSSCYFMASDKKIEMEGAIPFPKKDWGIVCVDENGKLLKGPAYIRSSKKRVIDDCRKLNGINKEHGVKYVPALFHIEIQEE